MAPSDRVISLNEVKEHTTDKSCWLILHGKVYDVTDFLEEHPGGYDIILTTTGKDATQEFEEIGHSNSAKALLDKYLIGAYEGGDSVLEPAAVPRAAPSAVASASPMGRAVSMLLPILVLLALVYVVSQGNK